MVVPKMLSSIEAAAIFKSTSPGAIPKKEQEHQSRSHKDLGHKIIRSESLSV